MEIDRLEAPYPSDCLGVDISEAADYTVYSELYNVKYDIHVSVLKFITMCHVCDWESVKDFHVHVTPNRSG